jgi:type VI secretion system secreted protein Hcp
MRTWLSASVVIIASLLAFAAPAFAGGASIWVTIEGSKQGKFKGDGLGKGSSGKIMASGFHYELSSPRDVATGQASGKRQHAPVCVTKGLNASSPQLFNALVSNEVLKSVLLEIVTPAQDGREEASYTIKLTNATLSKLAQQTDAQGVPSEDACFVFQKIEVTSVTGKTMGMDDWAAVK